MPPMPKLYPIDGLAPVPSEQDEYIPSDLEAPTFKSPIPKEHPPLILPEPVQVPSLTLPEMTTLVEDESTIDYEAYKEDEMPSFVFPHQDPLPLWEEPVLAELPKEPEYSVPEIIPPPILEPIPSFKLPLMDPRPCERSYYELKKDEKCVMVFVASMDATIILFQGDRGESHVLESRLHCYLFPLLHFLELNLSI